MKTHILLLAVLLCTLAAGAQSTSTYAACPPDRQGGEYAEQTLVLAENLTDIQNTLTDFKLTGNVQLLNVALSKIDFAASNLYTKAVYYGELEVELAISPEVGAGLASIDTIITTDAYTSYFNYQLKEPVYVAYELYQGGGSCSRDAYRFWNDIAALKGRIAQPKDYAKSGYDEGHLCNAQDEAGDCQNDESTFRFYNCVPQTPQLNRGIWKQWETAIRKQSQDDSLWIITGSVFGKKKLGPDKIAVPDYCWKVVESESQHKVIECIYCDNTSTPVCNQITISLLEAYLKQPLPLK